MERTFKAGITEVTAHRKTVNPETGTVEISKIHSGIVLQNCGAFVRVFNPRPVDDGGDPRPEWSEFYPTALGGTVFLEITNQRKHPAYIPPELRF